MLRLDQLNAYSRLARQWCAGLNLFIPTYTMLTLVPATDPILWTPSQPVTDAATQVLPYVEDMKALMDKHDGVGLAANQVGLPHAFFIARFSGSNKVWVVINPKTLETKGWNVSRLEGCLSFPGKETYVPRLTIIKAEWTDEAGAEMGNVFTNVDARIWAHETNHLGGVCIFPRPAA